MDDRQKEIADIYLKGIAKYGGMCSKDEYGEFFDRGIYLDYEVSLVWTLLKKLDLTFNEGPDDYRMALTMEGHRVAKIGIDAYLKELDNERETTAKLSKNQLLSTKTTIIIGILGLILASLSLIPIFKSCSTDKAKIHQSQNLQP